MEKHLHLESFSIYFPKVCVAQIMLGVSFVEGLDIILRLLSFLGGIVLTVYTIRRMHRDLKIRDEELKIKRMERETLERKIKHL